MYDIRPVARLSDDFLIGIAVKEVVLLAKELEDRKMEDTRAEISVCELSILFVFGFVPA
jgi:hypothetical protein